MKAIKNLVGGECQGSETVFDVINPFDESIAGRQCVCTPEQANRSLCAADEAAKVYRYSTISERVEILEKIARVIRESAEEFAPLFSAESGKPHHEALDELTGCASCFDYYVAEIRRHHATLIEDYNGAAWHLLQHEPVGVVVSFIPFNFPLWQFAGKLALALATGNACIIKVSEQTPMTINRIGERISNLDIPKGLISILSDCYPQGHSIMGVLAESPIPRLLTLIGSTKAGVELMRLGATTIKRYELELGGNAPVVVYDDAAPREAAKLVAGLKGWHSGQICVAPQRVLVPAALRDELLDELAKNYGAATDYNPIINEAMLQEHLQMVADALEKGATLVCGGKRDKRPGFFMQPTVLADVTSDMRVYCEEAFGPLLAVVTYSEEQDVIELANDTDYGLAAYVMTKNSDRIREASRRLRFGTVAVNNNGLWNENLPHGGVGQSGYGKNNSFLSLDSYVDIKRVSIS